MLLLTDLIKRKDLMKIAAPFITFLVAFFDQICDQGSGFTTRRPSNESLTKYASHIPVRPWRMLAARRARS